MLAVVLSDRRHFPMEFKPPDDALARALAILASHDAVHQLHFPKDVGRGSVTVVADFRVSLPSRCIPSGEAPNGVRAIEPITLEFHGDFPLRAPSIALRHDFDRCHPHINPSYDFLPPVPCLVDGSLDEFMHSTGFAGIANQISTWLDNAANVTLIDPNQGWEPVRRDRVVHTIVASAAKLRSLVDGAGRYYLVPFQFVQVDRESDEGGLIYAHLEGEPKPLNHKSFDQSVTIEPVDSRICRGRGVALVVTPEKRPDGRLPTADEYRPETVATVAELRERASDYGCLRALQGGLEWIANCARHWNAQGKWKFPLPVLVLAVRPFPVIGTGSAIELMPYVLPAGMPKLLEQGEDTPVWPAKHLHAVEPALLRRLSDQAGSPPNDPVVLVGCGSLGSHLGIGLGRMGDGPAVVIDNRYLQPHNAARHALLARDSGDRMFWIRQKADAMGDALSGLGQKPRALNDDIIDLLQNAKAFRAAIPRTAWGIINTTGSIAVREAMLASPYLKSRVIEGALFGEGNVSLLAVEGPMRNPNVGDLLALAYNQFRTRDALRQAVFSSVHTAREIGQGCNSLTMALPDAVVAQAAASMTMAVASMRVDGLPADGGLLYLGQRQGINLAWDSQTVAPFTVIAAENNVSWTIRISKEVRDAIRTDIAAWPGVETGGVLMGRFSEAARMFHVIGLLFAPSDSIRSPAEFVLGTNGLMPEIARYMQQTGNALYCLGTWHSHLQASGPSPKDRETAGIIKQGRIAPSILLIATPTGFCALVTGDH